MVTTASTTCFFIPTPPASRWCAGNPTPSVCQSTTATGLKPELRAAIENDLVDEYHHALCGYGVTGYDRETCWRDYRLGMPQVLLISALGFAFATATERGDDMVLTMLARGCQAIRDLGTLELIGEQTGESVLC